MTTIARKRLRARMGWASATAEARPSAYSPATETTVHSQVRMSEGQKCSSSRTVAKLSRRAKPLTVGLVRLNVVERAPQHLRERIGDQHQQEDGGGRDAERGDLAQFGR